MSIVSRIFLIALGFLISSCSLFSDTSPKEVISYEVDISEIGLENLSHF